MGGPEAWRISTRQFRNHYERKTRLQGINNNINNNNNNNNNNITKERNHKLQQYDETLSTLAVLAKTSNKNTTTATTTAGRNNNRKANHVVTIAPSTTSSTTASSSSSSSVSSSSLRNPKRMERSSHHHRRSNLVSSSSHQRHENRTMMTTRLSDEIFRQPPPQQQQQRQQNQYRTPSHRSRPMRLDMTGRPVDITPPSHEQPPSIRKTPNKQYRRYYDSETSVEGHNSSCSATEPLSSDSDGYVSIRDHHHHHQQQRGFGAGADTSCLISGITGWTGFQTVDESLLYSPRQEDNGNTRRTRNRSCSRGQTTRRLSPSTRPSRFNPHHHHDKKTSLPTTTITKESTTTRKEGSKVKSKTTAAASSKKQSTSSKKKKQGRRGRSRSTRGRKRSKSKSRRQAPKVATSLSPSLSEAPSVDSASSSVNNSNFFSFSKWTLFGGIGGKMSKRIKRNDLVATPGSPQEAPVQEVTTEVSVAESMPSLVAAPVQNPFENCPNIQTKLEPDMCKLADALKLDNNTRIMLAYYDARTVEDFSLMSDRDFCDLLSKAKLMNRALPPLQIRKVEVLRDWLKGLLDEQREKRNAYDDESVETTPTLILGCRTGSRYERRRRQPSNRYDHQTPSLPNDWSIRLRRDLPKLKSNLKKRGESRFLGGRLSVLTFYNHTNQWPIQSMFC